MNSDRPTGVKPRALAGRPRDAAKRDAILNAAWDAFVRSGVDGTSMEGVAALAGASKVTVYSHFPDKHALFEAVVRQRVDAMAAQRRQATSGGTLRARLITFGTTLMSFVYSDELLRFDAMLRAEVARAPALARLFWSAGPERALADLTAMLAAAAAAGELAFDEVEAAAEDLVGLWFGMSDKRRALGGYRGPPDVRVTRGVDLFLRLYGTDGSPAAAV